MPLLPWLSAPFLNCFSVSSGLAVFVSLLRSRARRAIKLHAFPAWILSPRVETLTHFDNLSKHTNPIAMKYAAFVALVAILPAAFAKAVDSPLGKSVSDSPSVCAATACPCHGAPNAAFCGDGLTNCIHGHLYQCANDGKSSCDLGAKADSCTQAAGLN
ncbi:hypothetical protein JB92DRAFT_3047245 [Gautieria morchelliformis]|nr:hypothetical protein JB92DRAFT_3047245 [Gautieria morchelliformis]